MEPVSSASLKFEKFAAKWDGQATQHIDNLRQVFTNPRYKLAKARDIYPFYASLQKILGETSEKPEMQKRLLKVLRLENGREIGRVGMPPIALDFTPFLDQEEYVNTLALHIVDPFNQKEVAKPTCIPCVSNANVFSILYRSSAAALLRSFSSRGEKSWISGPFLATAAVDLYRTLRAFMGRSFPLDY